MKNIYTLILLSVFALGLEAQVKFYHEVGGSMGATLISGDWGRSSSIGKVFGYDGVEANFIHNMQVDRSKFGLKSNLGFSYMKNKHNNDEWTGEGLEDPSEQNIMLREMYGTSMIITLGTQVEYNLREFGYYYPRSSWTPYIAAGFNVLYYIPSVTTPEGVPKIYSKEGIINKSGITTSIKGSLGFKYKLSRYLYMYGELTAQRSYSDDVDGLVPYSSEGTDYLSSFNVGVIYTLHNRK